MKSILLHVYNDSEFSSRLAVALDLVRAHDGHLTCLQVTPFNTFVAFDMVGGVSASQALLEQANAQAGAVQVETEARLVAEDVRWNWVSQDGDPATALVHAAALSDLVVVSQVGRGGGTTRPLPIVDALAVNAGCATLVVPGGSGGYDASLPVVIGWNGSDQAARAIRQTLPVLKRAGAVHVVAIGAREDDVSATAASHYLSLHGVSSEVHMLPATKDAAERLVECARAMGAGALVIGAYGHSRLRETLLGGVTERLIKGCNVPLYLGR